MDLKTLNRSCDSYYVIAEIGNNHAGDPVLCKEMILEAKLAGANAIKLQMRDNKTLCTREFYESPYKNENSYGDTYGKHRDFVELDPTDMIAMNDYTHELGIDFICTAFDMKSANFVVNELNCDAYKLASSDLCNPTLLDFFIQIKNPKHLILSSGGHTLEDISWTFNRLKSYKSKLSILHCISSYPAEHKLLNLRSINTIQELVGKKHQVGYSSHDNGTTMPLVAAVLGAKVIEKHFTLNRSAKGTDHAMSVNPTMLKNLVRDLKYLELCLGSPNKPVHEVESKPLTKMIKSPYFAQNLRAGTIISKEHIVEKIPFTGITLRQCYEHLIGKKLLVDVELEQKISEEVLK